MSITDELRKWGYGFCGSSYEVVNAIADRIDAEYRKSEDEWRVRNGQSWLHGYAECHTELLEGNETLAFDLESCGWVRLPKDADGEYIRIGDEVETTNFGTVEVEGFVHRAVAFYNYSEQPAYLCTTPANLCRHHHAPTVEDGIIAEYAKRLKLADGEDA